MANSSSFSLDRQPDFKKVLRSLERRNMEAFNRLLDKHIQERDKITETWSEETKPKWKKSIKRIGGRYEASLEVDAPNARGTDVSVWRLLNDGTKVRRAIMSQDYEPKTDTELLGSRPGKGKRAVVLKDAEQEGIEGRHWDEKINEKLEPELNAALADALEEALVRLVA